MSPSHRIVGRFFKKLHFFLYIINVFNLIYIYIYMCVCVCVCVCVLWIYLYLRSTRQRRHDYNSETANKNSNIYIRTTLNENGVVTTNVSED